VGNWFLYEYWVFLGQVRCSCNVWASLFSNPGEAKSPPRIWPNSAPAPNNPTATCGLLFLEKVLLPPELWTEGVFVSSSHIKENLII
jgi:hypothetical protein